METKYISRKDFMRLATGGITTLIAASCGLGLLDPTIKKLYVSVTFSEAMDKESVEKNTRLDAGTLLDPIEISWPDESTALFNFGDVDINVVSRLVILEGATDLAGNALGEYEQDYA